jgi:tight adherence protein C
MSASPTIDILLAALLVATIVLLIVMRRGAGRLLYWPALMRAAGYDPHRAAPLYWIAKVLFALLIPLLVMNVLPPAIGWPLLAPVAIVCFFIPDLWLVSRRRRRKARILQALSFFLDLLVSLLRSGLEVEEAFRRAGARGLPPNHPLAEEVRWVSDEIAGGADRAVAFGGMALRSRVQDLHALAAALELGSRLGFPVADILATQADIQRERRAERGRKRIDRAMMVALFPLLLCGVPLFVIVVVLPFVLELLKTIDLFKSFP